MFATGANRKFSGLRRSLGSGSLEPQRFDTAGTTAKCGQQTGNFPRTHACWQANQRSHFLQSSTVTMLDLKAHDLRQWCLKRVFGARKAADRKTAAVPPIRKRHIPRPMLAVI